MKKEKNNSYAIEYIQDPLLHTHPLNVASARKKEELNPFYISNVSIDLNNPDHNKVTGGISLIWLLIRSNKIDLLKKMYSQNPSIFIDLNEQPTNEHHLDKGISLGWLLIQRNELDLFKKMYSQNPSIFIDLNAQPTQEQHLGKGISLAWLLIIRNELDLFKEIYSKNPSIFIDLNAQSTDEHHRQKGISLAWLLLIRNELDLFKEIYSKNPSVFIDLNAQPADEHHPNKGISLAWLLLIRNELDLFKEIYSKNPSVFIDLNAQPADEHHPNKGISLAWMFIKQNELDLFKKIYSQNPSIFIDLNAQPTHEEHQDKGMSLAWLLTLRKELDLFKKIYSQNPSIFIDLNAQPTQEQHLGKGISLAWLLIRNNAIDLFKKIYSQSPSIFIDLNAQPTYDQLSQKGISLAWLLAARHQISLFSELIKNSPFLIDLSASPKNKQHPRHGCSLENLLNEQGATELLIKLRNPQALIEVPSFLSIDEMVGQNEINALADAIPQTTPNNKQKKAEQKIAFFSQKYLASEPGLKKIHSLDMHDSTPYNELNCQHHLIPLIKTFSKKWNIISHVESINSDGFLHTTEMNYYAAEQKELSTQTVTFIFAGRTQNAFLPDMDQMGDEQHCIVVLTSEEFHALNISSCPPSLGFLVINSLASLSHGNYENKGGIQSRRLAAFYASYYWNLTDCIYLDDNIEWIGLNSQNSSHELIWSQVTSYLKEQRELNKSFMSGLQTVRTSSHQIIPDYCYKIYSLNFQCIRELLDLENNDDIFILGYPATYANHCLEDFYFQMLLDIAVDSKKISRACRHIIDQNHAGFKRSTINSNMAKKWLAPYNDVVKIEFGSFDLSMLKENHQQWMNWALSYLKKQVIRNQKAFEARQQFEKTRDDLPQVVFNNTQIKKRKLSDALIPPNFILLDNIYSNDEEPQKASSSLKKKRKQTPHSSHWKLNCSNKNLNQLMAGDEHWNMETYLSQIGHLCYPYQQEALKKIGQSTANNGVLNIATGAGKTRLQILLLNYLLAKQDSPIYIITPTQQLVEQFYLSCEETINLLEDNAHVTMLDIIKVQSDSGNVPWKNYYKNDVLKKQAKVVIFCDYSFNKFQNELGESTDAINIQSAIILLDEFHLYLTTAKTILGGNVTALGFSATPPKEYQPLYHFSRLDSLQAKITVPMIIDRLPYKLSNTNEKRKEKISELLKSHRHPRDGQCLQNSKGIIFVSSIAQANELAQVINQDRAKPLALSVHSGLSNSAQLITQFHKKKYHEQGILIVVGMLQAGYDDKHLSWALIARNNNENSATVRQIIGRVLRKNPEDPEKIAYILADHHLNLSDFGLLKDQEAITKAHSKYFQVNRELLYLDIQYAIQKNESFQSYQVIFEQNCLKDHSLKKHLELALRAITPEWLASILHHNQQLAQDDILACFAYEAYGFFFDSKRTENKELYTAQKFQELLDALIQVKPHQVTSWLGKTEKKSCQHWMTKISTQFAVPHYINVLNEYQQKIKFINQQPGKVIPKTLNTSGKTLANNSLFAQPNTVGENTNSSYMYQDEDVCRILQLRLQDNQTPGLIVLGVANMSENYLGNRVLNILRDYVAGPFAPQRGNNSVENIIIPIVHQYHWVGIRIQLRTGALPEITYYNSIKNYTPDAQLIPALLEEVNQALSVLDLWPMATHIKPFEHALEQKDGTSCGAFLIENIYCDLEQKTWPTDSNLTQTIRARHLKLLQQKEPVFYEQFCKRQWQGESSALHLNLKQPWHLPSSYEIKKSMQ